MGHVTTNAPVLILPARRLYKRTPALVSSPSPIPAIAMQANRCVDACVGGCGFEFQCAWSVCGVYERVCVVCVQGVECVQRRVWSVQCAQGVFGECVVCAVRL
jgi:hypothetical protein